MRGPRCRAAVRQSVEAEEGGVGQGLRQALRQPGLAAAERTDDVVQRPDMSELEPLAAPWPGQVESDAERGVRRRQPRQLPGARCLASRKIALQATHLLDHADNLAQPALKHRLMRGQSRLQALGIALQHPRHLGEVEAQGAQGRRSRRRGSSRRDHRPAIRPRCGSGRSGRAAHRAEAPWPTPKPGWRLRKRSGTGRKNSRPPAVCLTAFLSGLPW